MQVGLHLLVLAAAVSAKAQGTSSESITECVGRFELTMPSTAMTAAQRPRERRAAGDIRLFESDSFEDGVPSGYSRLSYEGEVTVTHALTEAQWQFLLKGAKNLLIWGDTEGTLDGRDKRPRVRGAPRALTPSQLERLNGLDWGVRSRNALVRLGNHALDWQSWAEGEPSLKAFKAIDQGLVLRPPGTSPQRQGVCLPYFFIPDDGTIPRNISMTFRLLAHPDVLINLEDASAARLDPTRRPTAKDPDDMTISHWEQHTFQTKLDTIGLPWMKHTKMANYPALSTKVRLTRQVDQGGYKAGDENFAYLTLVRGDPDATTDMPDLRLYIIQRAHLAKSKGIEPLTEKQFFALAESIRDSIRRRGVQP